ncbi:MAG: protein kinase [Luteitalea sp.]|nr:protein kinase [Luteitalea sp.]
MKRVARCASPAPSGSRDTTTTSARLPDDLLLEQVRRLTLFSAVAGSLWTFALGMDVLVAPSTVGRTNPTSTASVLVEIAEIVASVLMVAFLRFSSRSSSAKTDVGLGYMLVNAAGIAALNSLIGAATITLVMQVSWIAILILVFSMISPAPPRKTLVVSLAAASMDPLAVWLAHVGTADPWSPLHTLLLFLPNYVLAVVVMVPARLYYRIGRRLREAQDLGSYQLVELLGHGGMGEVWRAQHRLLARNAAVKLVRPEILGVATETEVKLTLRRFEREARATAALSSPHTIHVFDFGLTDDGTFYYVMELLTGRGLESLVREFGPLPADRVSFLLRQVCHSLAYAHARGLVHRDIKPANIYVCRMGLDYDFVKVLDFGLVKLNRRNAARQTLLTMDHRTTGTPAYMAPEIVLGDTEVDRRADVYALGCVAYYLLTGQLVFEADTPMKMLLHHVQTKPVPPSQRSELPIPRELDDLVLACLEKDPAKRPQDAEELLRLAYSCKTCESWTDAHARSWWQTHLSDLTGPLAIEAIYDETATDAVVFT